MGTAARCRDFRCSGRGGALSPPAARGRRRFCRGRPMCRPGHVPSRDPSAGGHIGPPLRGGEAFRNQRVLAGNDAFPNGAGQSPPPTGGAGVDRRRGEVTPPYGCNAGGAKQRADVPRAWPPPPKFRPEIWGVGHRHRPLRRRGRHAGASCPTGVESGRFWGNCETFPKHRRSKSAKKTEFVQKTGEFRWTFPARWCTIRRSMR